MRTTNSTTVKPAQRMRRGVIMEHHLEFGRFRLQRGRNRGARRGCRWNLYGHYKPAGGRECQYFSRVAAVSKRRKGRLTAGRRVVGKIVRPGVPRPHLNGRSLIESAVNPCII